MIKQSLILNLPLVYKVQLDTKLCLFQHNVMFFCLILHCTHSNLLYIREINIFEFEIFKRIG